jgi:FKBP-type peptidyl-prolyl cis-trans isomerase SlyD
MISRGESRTSSAFRVCNGAYERRERRYRRIEVQIAADSVVLIHYTLKNDDGKVLDSSAGGEPLAYIQGHGNLVSGLEKALEGKTQGNRVEVTLAPADGYGVRNEALVQRVPKRSLQGAGEIRKGMQFQAQTDEGMRVFTVTTVVGDMVTLDGNHPLADQTLHFDVEVVDVRGATAEELEHGHVHGAGGHHH